MSINVRTVEWAGGDQTGIIANKGDPDQFSAPVADGNRHWLRVQAWVAQGNSIAPFQAPPVPTDAERVVGVFSADDKMTVLFKLLFDQENRIRALESRATVTAMQYRNFLKTQLPPYTPDV